MKIACLICARGNSKGLKNKNILKINKIPLVAHTIKFSKRIKQVQDTFISTDSNKIAKISKNYGALVPFIRPKKLSTDSSPEWLSWKHFLLKMKEKKTLPEILLVLPVTAPLRRKIDVEKCINTLIKNNYDGVIAVTKSKKNPYFNMVTKDNKNQINIFTKLNKNINRRQDAPEVFEITTNCYVFKSTYVMKKLNMLSGKVHGVEVPYNSTVDIDTKDDFIFAKKILEK